MAQAMIESIIKSQIILPENIIGTTRTEESGRAIEQKYNIKIEKSNIELARQSDYIILAVKPKIYDIVLKEIKNDIKEGAIVIAIGAGISSDYLKNNLKVGTKYLKAMPNTPAMVGEGITAISTNAGLTKEDIESILEIFNSFGRTEIIDESLMDGFTGLCGSSPAYIFMLIEAMADGGVLEGIPRSQAYTMAAQAVLGSAKMVLESGIHPAQLKDNVCSPGGTTIEAVSSLEDSGFRKSIIKAIKVCADKSREMTRKPHKN